MRIMSTEFEPKILAFTCNWCSYAGADLAGTSRLSYPPNVRIIRVMCSGRVEPFFILEAFRSGIDGVLVTGCHPADCHYVNGNRQAEIRVKFVKRILRKIDLEPERLRLEWISASEGARFAELIKDSVTYLKKLGPSPLSKDVSKLKQLADLMAAEDAVSGFRLRTLVGKERKLVIDGNVYGERKLQEEFDKVIDNAIDAEYTRSRIYFLIKDKPRSVKELSQTLGLDPRKVLRHVVAMRRKGLVAVDRVEGTSPLYSALRV